VANPKSFPLVRGRTMRVTAVDQCCAPAYGPDAMVVTDGFVSVALTANITEAEEIVVTNANGKTCVRDPGCSEFQGYGVEITFCEVSPCLFSIVTGQPAYVDAAGNIIGFRMNSGVSVCASGFALEVWMGVPGVACAGDAGAFGYLLLPCLTGGVIGDFTIENAAVTFTVTGAATKDGNGWGVGPYNVVGDGVSPAGGSAGPLPSPLEADDHLLAIFTTVPPPDETDGCVELLPPTPGAPLTVAITLGLTGPTGEAEVGGGPDGGVRIEPARAGTPISMSEISAIDWGDGQVDSPPDTSGGFVAHVYDQAATAVAIKVWDKVGGTGTSATFDVI
jgi:hypothetical protein